MHHCTHCIVYGTHMPGRVLHTQGLEGKTKGKSAENTNLGLLCPSKGSNVFTSVALNWLPVRQLCQALPGNQFGLRNRDFLGSEKPKVWSLQLGWLIPTFSRLSYTQSAFCWPDPPECTRRESISCVPTSNTHSLTSPPFRFAVLGDFGCCDSSFPHFQALYPTNISWECFIPDLGLLVGSPVTSQIYTLAKIKSY